MKEEKDILVSIVIPVKNGDYWLESTLKGILEQEIDGKLEVIVIDSGSTDKSLEIIDRFPVRLIRVLPAEFNHGGTRNMAVQNTRGKYVVMTVQDAVPANRYWLAKLLEGFTDEDVAGVCGLQIVAHDPGKNPFKWYRPQSLPVVTRYKFTPEEFKQLAPAVKRNVCGWDNVTAMYRREILLKVPFREVMFAEDALWAMDAILNRYSIVYNPAAQTCHYHEEELQYLVRRTFTVYFHFYKFFGYQPPYIDNGLVRKLKDAWLLLKESKLSLREKWKWYRINQQIRQKTNETVAIFYKALSEGDSSLESMHTELCKEIPQAIKPEVIYSS